MRNDKLLRNLIVNMELPMYRGYKYYQYYDVLSRLSMAVFQIDFEIFRLHYLNEGQKVSDMAEIKNDHIKDLEDEALKKQKMQEKEAELMAELLKNEEFLNLIDLEGHHQFSSFDKFYSDMERKLNDSKRKVALNEELKGLQRRLDWMIKSKRDPFNSRIL